MCGESGDVFAPTFSSSRRTREDAELVAALEGLGHDVSTKEFMIGG